MTLEIDAYVPSEARVSIDYCNAAVKRSRPDGSFMSMEEADAAFTRFLAKVWDAGFDAGHYVNDEESRDCDCRHNPYREGGSRG